MAKKAQQQTQKKEMSKKQQTKMKKKKKVAAPPKIMMYVTATYNNTIVSATDYSGNVLSSSSCGRLGFAGSKKSTAYAATRAGEDAATKVKELGAKEAEVVIKGIGVGRQAAIKGIRAAGIKITLLSDHTSVPHGGCKPRRAPKK